MTLTLRSVKGARLTHAEMDENWLTLEALSDSFVSVKDPDFDATGDGTSDDSAAIQAAIDSLPATGGTVLFPPGTYLLGTTGITIPAASMVCI